MTLGKLDSLSLRDAHTFFHLCCGSTRWIDRMTADRPFGSLEKLFSAADEVWFELSPDDWKEAFAHHPKIGDIKNLRKKFAGTAKLAEGEQSGVEGTSERVLKALSE